MRGAPPLRVVLASGCTYQITARCEAASSRLVQEALLCPAGELVPRSGGLLSNLSVLENILLPAMYHRRVSGQGLAGLVYQGFEACGLERPQADALCDRAVTDLDSFGLRLVALVRSLLLRPALLLMERIFEGLTEHDMERVSRFAGYYRRVVAGGTLVFFDLAGMPRPEVHVDIRADAE